MIHYVYRQLEAVGELIFVGGGRASGKFTDASVPAGSATIVYKIQGVRSSAIGEDAEFIVRFGTNSGGAMSVSVEPKASPKMAA